MRRGERGALLADALVAMSVFGVILGTWAGLTTLKFKTIGEADRRFRAVQAAESVLAEAREGMRAPGRFEVPGGAGLGGVLEAAPRADGLRELTVTVSWREPGAEGEESVRLTTLGRP